MRFECVVSRETGGVIGMTMMSPASAVVVCHVERGPAYDAGIRCGDIVCSVNGVSVYDHAECRRQIERCRVVRFGMCRYDRPDDDPRQSASNWLLGEEARI